MGYLSICAIAKDEDSYLPEWISYHRIMGVSHFYIYDNGSAIPISKAVEKVSHGDVTVIPYPGHARQVEAYTDAIGRVSGKTTWAAFVDIDEFLVPKKTLDIPEALKPYEAFGGVSVNWQTFGPSGRKVKPECLQMEAYQKRNAAISKVNEHLKAIVRPDRVLKGRDPHSFFFKDGFYAVNEKSVRVDGSFSPVSTEIFQLNHYFTRTIEEYKFKISKGCPNGAAPKDMRLFDAVEREATEFDPYMNRFSCHVRAALYNDGIITPAPAVV